MEEMMKKFVEVLKNNPNHAYDFISNNSYLFSKSELTDIIKELLYGIYTEAQHGLIDNADHDKILLNTAEGLEENYTEE